MNQKEQIKARLESIHRANFEVTRDVRLAKLENEFKEEEQELIRVLDETLKVESETLIEKIRRNHNLDEDTKSSSIQMINTGYQIDLEEGLKDIKIIMEKTKKLYLDREWTLITREYISTFGYRNSN
jgi:hypothetical protein